MLLGLAATKFPPKSAILKKKASVIELWLGKIFRGDICYNPTGFNAVEKSFL
jgi:hypothetical protein